MAESGSTLIFVYNADSGLLSAVKDAFHKAISPGTYPCRLCALTYGAIRMKPTWRRFVDGLGILVEFIHRDEFLGRYPTVDAEFPSAYVKTWDDLTLLVSRDEMNCTNTLEELMELVTSRLEEIGDR